MSRWGYSALTMAALCSLPAFCLSSPAGTGGGTDLYTAGFEDESPLAVGRSLSAQTDAKLQTNSLHQNEQLGTVDTASLSSASYNMLGIKPGLPATCYGQPCSASACYPAALVTVKKYVNYVNVTAQVQFSRRYKVQHSALLTLSGSLANIDMLVSGSARLCYVLLCCIEDPKERPLTRHKLHWVNAVSPAVDAGQHFHA